LFRRTSGAAALEFSIIVLPFAALSFAIIETCMMMFTSAVVQGALAEAARDVRTGQISAPPGTSQSQIATIEQTFANQVCNDTFGQVDCSGLYFDIRSFASFGAISLPDPVFDSEGAITNTSFDTGGSGQIVTVRVIYVWHTITPGLNYLLGAGASQNYTMQYTVVMQNEPF
jgi:Flp pilus assembly protein TadG